MVPQNIPFGYNDTMVVFYALLSALSYGTADFLGGLSSRRNSPLTVVAWSQFMGLVTVLVAAPILGSSHIPLSDLIWGMAAGIAGASGVGLLFKGLASGYASIVSPTAALTGAVLPVLYGLILGERPEALAWVGIGLALPAILLLSLERGGKNPHVIRSLQMGLLAGTAFSGFFILIAQTGEGSGMWPLAAARGATVPLFFLLAKMRGRSLKIERKTGKITFISGFLDMGANIFYLLAARTGYLIIAVILTALYPAPTVLAQRVVLGEKLTKARIFGLLLSIAGAALIGIGG